jgi:hypothetical protein
VENLLVTLPARLLLVVRSDMDLMRMETAMAW